jgi:hypothetical protein
MSIQELGAIGEMIGGVAVLITLIYLAIQVRQASVTTHRQMYGQAAEAISSFWMELAADPQLYDAYLAMLRPDHQPDSPVARRGYLIFDAYLSLLESFYLHNREYGEQLSQERWQRVLERLIDTPGGRAYWERRREYFHVDFAAYVEKLLEDSGHNRS